MGEVSGEVVLKCVVCGDGASGKTSLCLRLVNDSFDSAYKQTLGLDFFTRRITLPDDVGVTLQVWDVGGQSISSSMIDKYIHGAHAVIVAYDITNSASFEDVNEWVSTVKRLTKNSEQMPVLCLLGNKADLEGKRTVKVDKHTSMAIDHDMLMHYCSAKTGDSVLLVFRSVAAAVLKIPLTKAEVERDIVPVHAEATLHIDQPRRRPAQTGTTVCTTM